MAEADIAGGLAVAGADGEETRGQPHALMFTALAIALAAAAILSLSIGATGISLHLLPSAVTAWMEGASDSTAALVLFNVRLPRTLLAMFVGAALAVAGAMMQGLFRNPLADPGLVGVSSGAALAAVSIIALGNGIASPVTGLLGVHALPVAAFVGGFGVTVLLVVLSGGPRHLSIAGLLLAGIAIGAAAQAAMGLLVYVSDDRALRDLTLWTLGSFAGASWDKVLGVVPFALLALALLPRLVRGLNGLLLGESEAFHLGINIRRTKYAIVLVTAALVGSAVAVAGMIGFIGVVVPHVVRLMSTPDHATLLPASGMLGAILALVADIFARTAVAPAELPVGIVMALIGAPFFLHLILKRTIHV
jgi:iron complex transport system permease protein